MDEGPIQDPSVLPVDFQSVGLDTETTSRYIGDDEASDCSQVELREPLRLDRAQLCPYSKAWNSNTSAMGLLSTRRYVNPFPLYQHCVYQYRESLLPLVEDVARFEESEANGVLGTGVARKLPHPKAVDMTLVALNGAQKAGPTPVPTPAPAPAQVDPSPTRPKAKKKLRHKTKEQKLKARSEKEVRLQQEKEETEMKAMASHDHDVPGADTAQSGAGEGLVESLASSGPTYGPCFHYYNHLDRESDFADAQLPVPEQQHMRQRGVVRPLRELGRGTRLCTRGKVCAH